MKRNKILLVLMMPLILFFLSSGCTRVRTYTVEKERVDQVMGEGNQGYLAGQSTESSGIQKRKLTRKTYVAEVEVGLPVQKKKQRTVSSEQPKEIENTAPESEKAVVSQPISVTAPATATVVSEQVTTYTVERNDTLQKISQKVYGTANKWKIIFESNKEQLKTPDRIYAGQVLKIPQEEIKK